MREWPPGGMAERLKMAVLKFARAWAEGDAEIGLGPEAGVESFEDMARQPVDLDTPDWSPPMNRAERHRRERELRKELKESARTVPRPGNTSVVYLTLR